MKYRKRRLSSIGKLISKMIKLQIISRGTQHTLMAIKITRKNTAKTTNTPAFSRQTAPGKELRVALYIVSASGQTGNKHYIVYLAESELHMSCLLMHVHCLMYCEENSYWMFIMAANRCKASKWLKIQVNYYKCMQIKQNVPAKGSRASRIASSPYIVPNSSCGTSLASKDRETMFSTPPSTPKIAAM